MKVICFDYDAICFRAAAANQKRSIKCFHKPTGNVEIFKTRTEFYGHHKKKSGGWLAQQEGLLLEDYTIEDVVEPEPMKFALKSVRDKIKSICEELQADVYYGYVGGDTNFRKDICTLLPYKGQRTGELPVHLSACKEYVVRYHNAKVSELVEADDLIATDNYLAVKNKEDFVAVCLDKDFKGCDGNWYYYLDEDYREVRGFGKLWRKSNGDVDGVGRLFKYWQVCGSDSADNYFAHCFSDAENGDVTAYNALKGCKNDTEAFLAMKEHFQYLYPEPKEITNWRGDTFTVDWFYVMNEMFQLAHLRRWKDDIIDLRKAFQGLKIEI